MSSELERFPLLAGLSEDERRDLAQELEWLSFEAGATIFIEGDIGKVLHVVPIVLILVLVVSLVEAFCVLPAHLAHSLHGHETTAPGRVMVEK